jgi:hypothetical protein
LFKNLGGSANNTNLKFLEPFSIVKTSTFASQKPLPTAVSALLLCGAQVPNLQKPLGGGLSPWGFAPNSSVCLLCKKTESHRDFKNCFTIFETTSL